MKKLFVLMAMGGLLFSCGGKEKKEEKGGFEVQRSKTEAKTEAPASAEIPVDLDNKGVGPIKSVDISDEIDAELASQGEAKFKTLCVACHQIDKRLIGPALAGVTDRRSPEWIMNMILNPDGMIKEDPIAKALLKEYNNAIMLNQNLSEEDARALVEYFRSI